MIAIDNANPGTAELCFAIAFVLALIAAVAYASRRADAVVWAPVLGWLSVAAVSLGWWVG